MASPAAILQVFVNANTKVASAQLAAFEKQLHGVGKTSAATSAGMGKFTKGAAAAGTGIAAFAVAAGIAGKQLYDLGKQFDDAYDTIRVRTGATGKELEKLKKDFRSVATTVPDDFKTIGEAIGGLNQRLGVSGKPLRQLSTQMLNLSRITGTDLDSNIKAVARSFVDFEVPAKRQRRTLDGLFRLYQKSGASVEELASSVQRFGSPLRTLGFSFEEAASMFANFQRAGVNTQTMVPGLKLAIGNLVKPTADFAKTMAQLGVDTEKPGPALRQIMELLGPGGNLTNVQKMSLAMQVFGKRAGADMAEAIKQGRFNLDAMLKTFRNGKGINDTANATNDFSENMGKFGNRLKNLVRPAAEAVFDAMTKLSAFLAGPQGRKGIKIVSQAFRVAFAGIRYAVKPMVQAVIGGFKAISGGVKFVKSIIGPIKSTFESVKSTITEKLRAAYVSVATFVNKIISVISSIPGVDISPVSVSTKGNPYAEGSSKRGKAAFKKQRGGIMAGGSPTGDSIPAMLERGEYVLNRKAVEKIGVKRLNQINFKSAPRFQKGGAIGLQGGGYLDTLSEFPAKFVKPIADAGTAALDLLMNGPGQFLKMLPKPNIPQPFTGVGPYLLDKATSFIKKNATSPLKDNGWVDSNTFAVARFLANKFNASISSSYRSPAENARVGGVPNSSHTRGTPSNPGAFDFVPPSGGMQSFAGKNIAGIAENMIHDVGSGLHNHIAFFRRGGLVGRSRKANKGGWHKTGYTVFDDAMGYRAPLRGKAYAELGAPNGGVGYISKLLGINKELPYNFPLDVKVNGKIARLYKRDIGYGQGTSAYSIDIWKSMWPFFGLNSNSSGPAWIRAARSGPSNAEIKKQKKAEKRRQKMISKITRVGARFPQKGKLFSNSKAIARQEEIIELAQRAAGADFGDAGSEFSDKELETAKSVWSTMKALQMQRLRLLKAAKAYLENLKREYAKARGKTKSKEIRDAYSKGISSASKSLGQVNADIRGLVGLTGKGGKIGETNFELQSLGFQAAGGTDSELASLLREQLTVSQRNLAIAQAQAPIFQQFMPKFHQGGIVQGPRGAERPIMAQAGEGVFTRDQMRAMGSQNITVVIEDGAIDSNRIRVEVDGVLQDKVSTVRRTTPNRRYSTR